MRSRRACEVCGSRDVRKTHESRQQATTTVQCTRCKLVWIDDLPSAREHVVPAEMPYDAYDDGQRGDEQLRLQVLDRLAAHLGTASPTLFDVGAGTGAFLDLARKRGFAVAGNDISPHSVIYCRDRYGIDIDLVSLADQPESSADAISMWCVLAHVDDATSFLRAALRMLRPGGVLFLRTPRHCGIDSIGRGLTLLSGGRFDGISERRVNLSHRRQYDSANLRSHLGVAGFDRIEIDERAHYPFATDRYVAHAGAVSRAGRVVTPAVETLIERGLFFRNALLAYACRPAT